MNLYRQKLVNMKAQLNNQKNINQDNLMMIQQAEDKYQRQQEIHKQLQIKILTGQRDILAAEHKHSHKTHLKVPRHCTQQSIHEQDALSKNI